MMPAAQAVPMSLPSLLGRDDNAGADIMISGMQLDSRKVRPGDLFLAMPGELHDGRQFIEQAVANGAAAVVAEAPVAGFVDDIPVPLVELPELHFEAGIIAARFYRNPSHSMHVVGVTGTNGKTTTSRIVGQLTRARGKSCGVIGTLGITLGDDISAAVNTTPDALSLQQKLAEWLEQGVLSVCMEVSSHALEQGRVNGVEFTTAIYTNLSHDHLDYHGTMDAYGRAKLRLFASEGLQYAVINADDPFVDSVRAAVAASAQVITYSASGAAADLRIENAQFGADGVRAMLHSPWGSTEFFSPLPGDFNLANLAAAVASLALAGESLPAILDAVAGLQPVPGRMALVPNNHGLQVVVDYAHTPDALEHVLMALRPHVGGSLITVFGCGGDRDREKRQVMGRVACSLSDRVVVTSDNPRSEEPLRIMRDIESGCSGDYTLVVDRAEAIESALSAARSGDCIVIAGKGHEDYQLVDGVRLPFSDEAHARSVLAGRMVS
ncbi:UDP-N-acetylmuramoyl-L-alanyl-D-glutamate--2,6-diaminopimelate ligase [Halioglobus japonicus]|nr:UDP-N-acetylmuramoyl-L-alanyl-D-glutamate--2,6-diaminopimelate ligase [Halioglobus japonicus]